MTIQLGEAPEKLSGIDALFKPRTVAVIGASASPEKPSHMPLRNLLLNRFPGEIFPVNQTSDEILGVRTYRSIDDIQSSIDLAYLVIPAGSVVDELERCAAKGISCAVVAASGFAETDSAEGRMRQAEIAELAGRTGMRILGPNTNGLYNTAASMSLGYNAANEREFKPGVLSIVSHSGALFNAIAGQMQQRGIGLGAFVSVGNEADLTMFDLVEYCVEQTDATVIAMVMESVRDGHRLRQIADSAHARGKKLVALKLGRSEAGARATVAHSSRLAGSSAAYQAWLEDAGVPMLRSLESIAGLAAIAEQNPTSVRTGGLGVVTFSGGGSALVVDTASDLSIPVAELAAETIVELESHLTRPAPLMNPLDMGAGIPLDNTYEALSAVSSDASVGTTVVFLHSMQTLRRNVMIAEAIAAAQRDTGVLHSVVAPGGVSAQEAEILRDAGIALFTDTSSCLSSIKPLMELQSRSAVMDHALPAATGALPAGVIGEREGLELLTRWGVPAVVPRAVTSADEAMAVADEIGYPVVMKGLVDGVAHKAAAGLVHLGLKESSAVGSTFELLRGRMAALATADGEIILEPAVDGEFEAFVGSSREPGLGHFLVAGLGGVYTEAIQQVVLWSLPVGRDSLRSRLATSALGRMFQSLEQKSPGVTEQFIDVLDRVQNVVLTHRDSIEAIDLNPMLITAGGPIAVDALLVASDPDQSAR